MSQRANPKNKLQVKRKLEKKSTNVHPQFLPNMITSGLGVIVVLFITVYCIWKFYFVSNDKSSDIVGDNFFLDIGVNAFRDHIKTKSLKEFNFVPHINDENFYTELKSYLFDNFHTIKTREGKYTGQWNKQNKYHGFGILEGNDNNVYIGQFYAGVNHGQGKLILTTTNEVYEGTFNKGSIHGYAKYRNSDTDDSYSGDFVHDIREGQGEFIFGRGDKYKGSIINGVFHGQGVYTFSDGVQYIGEFANGEFVSGKSVGVDGEISVFEDGTVSETNIQDTADDSSGSIPSTKSTSSTVKESNNSEEYDEYEDEGEDANF